MDGTLTGHTVGNKRSASNSKQHVYAVAKGAFTNTDPSCSDDKLFANGLTCISSNSWIRMPFVWNTPQSSHVKFTNNRNMTVGSKQQMVRLTYQNAMMIALESNSDYTINPVSRKPSNISFLVSEF